MKLVLAIDDDSSILHLLKRSLAGFDVVTATDGDEAMARLQELDPDVVLLDIVLPDVSGLDLYLRIRALDSRLPVIFMTADDSSESVIKALKLGAFDYITKPIEVGRLRGVVDEAIEARRQMSVAVEIATERSSGAEPMSDRLIGHSPGMLAVYAAIARSSGQDVHVLIRGESGTGKELVARAIYQHGGRSKGPFLAVNCAALTESLLESELFGHEKGAFTGANCRRIGKFERCDRGTIFLDEVGDMPLAVQAKVLRVLHQQEFQRVGGNETIKTDVRIISATNRPLEEMCGAKEFRDDLFFRLNGFPIDLPPLRERGDDRRLLVEYFMTKLTAELGLSSFEGISPDAVRLLIGYSWPGNVREMQTVIKQALLAARGPVLVPEFLPARIVGKERVESAAETESMNEFIMRRLEVSTDLYAESVEFLERRLLERVLRATRGNQSRAAEILGITRGKLRNRIKTFEFDIESFDEGAAGS